MAGWTPIPGETPIDPSGLKVQGVRTRHQLIPLEAENIRKATMLFLAERPTAKSAPFSYDWLLFVHEKMFGDVWQWAGQIRQIELTLGTAPYLIGQELGGLVLNIQAWEK